MLRLTELKLPLDHSERELEAAVLERLRIAADELLGYSIFKRSHDARKRSAIVFIYTLDVEVRNEPRVLERLRGRAGVARAPDTSYRFVAQAPPLPVRGRSSSARGRADCSPVWCSRRWASARSCSSAARTCAAAPRILSRCGAARY
jgi:hypothetical protein